MIDGRDKIGCQGMLPVIEDEDVSVESNLGEG